MTAFLAIVGVQVSLAVMLFGTLLLDRPATEFPHPDGHPHLRFLRRRVR